MRFSLVCQNCHGTMSAIANSINNGRRPWLDEPKCGSVTCHGSNFAEQTGKLYRESKGHGGLYCSACHGSPHTIFPTREANDNLQSIRLQGHAGAISNCLVCHSSPPTGAGPHGITYIGIKQISGNVPEEYNLYQNYPNPFNPVTSIEFDVPVKEIVSIKIYDNRGAEIKELFNNIISPGKYNLEWSAENFSSGIYFCKMVSGSTIKSIKMMLVK
jgi:hypothetical protein